MEGACILCGAVTSYPSATSGDDVTQRLTSLLQLSVVMFSEKHQTLCPSCATKICQMEAAISEIKRIYLGLAKSYDILFDDGKKEEFSTTVSLNR